MAQLPGLSNRFNDLKPSATVEMTEKVRRLRASGREIIGLSSGDPNVRPHPAIVEALAESIQSGETTYGPSQGKESLRKALSTYLSNRSKADYDPGEIIVTPGGKFAVYASILSVVDPGDEVLVLEPGWVSYSPCIILSGGTPVPVNCLDAIDVRSLMRAVTPKTKAIIVNTPVNPTGRIISETELKCIADLAKEHNLWVISDEVYAELIYAPHRHFSIAALDDMKKRTLLVDSFSKTFGMTGWRLGSLALPRERVKSILKIVQHSIYCVPPFIQTAAEKALTMFPDIITEIREGFRLRVEYAQKRLNALPGFSCPEPAATFYLFPAIDGDDRKVSMQLLDDLNIAVLPGSAFGSSGAGHIRFSLTCPMDVLEQAMHLLQDYYA